MAHMTHEEIILDVMEYSRIEDHFAVTTPAEKSEMIMNDLFTKYPILKPSTDKETKDVKKSFMEFLDMSEQKKNEIFSGSGSQHKELSHVLKELAKLMMEDFEKLDEIERDDVGEIAGYVIHKLCINEVLEVYRKKRRDYRRAGRTDEEMYQISMLMGATYANQWGIDPLEIVEEWMTKLNPDHYDVDHR
uniref:Uncharacterized protein n=1 Tax=Pristionchus pacificus TaxID=54126 RepID=A0A8R1UQ09_PRIPA